MSFLLSITCILSLCLSTVSATSLDDTSPQEIHFETSFESEDPSPLESKLDGDRSKNVEAVSDVGRLEGDVTHLVCSDTIWGSQDFKAEEGKHNLFDYSTSSKFLTSVKPSESEPVEVGFELEQPAAVQTYLIASGTDEPSRDPSAWTFFGSQDKETWVELDKQQGVTFSSREEKKTFSFSNATAYRYYKIVVTQNCGAPMTQFSELQLASQMVEPAVDLTSLLDPDSVEAPDPVNDIDVISNLFDYNTNSKYVTSTVGTAEQPLTLSFRLKKACETTEYTIASGNDEDGRDPLSWTLYGSSDGADWKVIDKQKNVTFNNRQQKLTFAIAQPGTYQWFKLEIVGNHGAPMTQFSEVQMRGVLPGCATPYIDMSTLDGDPDFNENEGKDKLFDFDTGSKYVTSTIPVDGKTVSVSFALTKPFVIDTYIMGSGPDMPNRNPMDWTLYGSNDGDQWDELDSREGETFRIERDLRSFSFENHTAYQQYKLVISKINGATDVTQFSELHLLGTPADGKEAQVSQAQMTVQAKDGQDMESSPMKTRKSRGPSEAYSNLTSTGWTGWSALEVKGRHMGDEEAYCYNVIYDGLSIPVTQNTNLSYVFFPALDDPDGYDFDFTSQHMAVDLKFSDGTYLSELGARDQYGAIVSPMEQGEADILSYMQWNHIYSNIGSVAQGKTIEQILIGYHKADNPQKDTVFLGYFDDIKIETQPPIEYDHLSDYVNILRGTNNTWSYSRGITTPLVTMPHGFNSIAPATDSKNTTPYVYQLAGSKTVLRHMTITHAASPWLGDWGTWQFMPNTDIDYDSVTTGTDINADRRASTFTHEKEEAKAHYYSVTFEEGTPASNVTMEVTPTSHAMYTRFTFPEGSQNRNLIFDCEWADGGLTFHGDGSFTAYSDHVYGHGEYSPGRANGATRMYIYGVIDQPYEAAKAVDTKMGIIKFGSDTNTVTMKLATSFISEEQAKHNLELEIAENDTFDSIFQKAQAEWDDQLGVIQVEGASFDQKITLYSGLYRMFAYPTLYSENAGTNEHEEWVYSSPYHSQPTEPVVTSGKMYTINGFWDTYRSAWPAYSLFTPTMAGEMIDGLLEHYKDSGWVSRWVAPGAINCMLGTHADAIFGDAMAKGIQFDYEAAFDASLKNSAVVSDNLDKGGRIQTATSVFRGYVSRDVHESFSWGMEDTINDYNISKMAEILGKTDEAAYYKNRALNYVNYFNEDLGWYMGRNSDGTFRVNSMDEFDPSAWHEKSGYDYCESNAWNMSFTAVQDIQGMINLYGGKEAALKRLDDLFSEDMRGKDVGQREMREVRLGQYNHTNEPSMSITHLYNYLGQPYRTQELTRDVIARCYTGNTIGQGYLGDEDNGAASAWYVFNALGFYPASVGTAEYSITSPLYTKATIRLENGKQLVINAPENSRENVYIQNVKFNGEDYDKVYFTHDQLTAGGVIDFEMGSTPSNWGTGSDAVPSSITSGDAKPKPLADIIPSDVTVASTIEEDKATVVCGTSDETRYLFDNSSDSAGSLKGQNKEIVFYTPEEKVVSMYTLTSDADTSNMPHSFALYGSMDGQEWVLLDSREDQTFQWGKYTRPYALDESKQSPYKYFKFQFDEERDLRLAEIELIGSEAIPEIKVDPSETRLEAGQTTQLTATVTPADAGTIVWSSSDETVATVDENGMVTALKAGEATITASLDTDPSIQSSCIVTVEDKPVIIPEIKVDPSETQLEAGQTTQLTATVTPADAGTIVWRSSDETVATVDENGMVTALKAGEVTITASLDTDPNVFDRCVVTVVEKPVAVDKAKLEELYQAHKDKQKGDYTDETWTAFTEALEQAKDVLEDPSASQDDVDNAYEALLDAISELKEEIPPISSSPEEGSSSEPSQSTGSGSSGTDSPNTDATSSPLPILLLLAASAGVMICVYLKQKTAVK
ncbi:Beta-L-arabinobiosidase precursor [Eubacteriaceae bacterium CHKCI005]|nr:Beta-L-arabinobiosidase precursor [Eubacteriaceae bacterium CHKCI005]